jgi:hypothetical protein
MKNEQVGTLVEPLGRAFATTRAGPALIVATDVDQQGASRLHGEGLGWSGTIPQHPPSLDHQIVHGHPHLARPCFWVLLRQ